MSVVFMVFMMVALMVAVAESVWGWKAQPVSV